MKNLRIILILAFLLFQCCGMSDGKKAAEKQKEKEETIRDSIELDRKTQLEKAKVLKDSITSSEQKIAIGGILFEITEKEFKNKKSAFLKKCELPEEEFYKGATIFRYKLGEYGFSDLYGWFYKDSLYYIRLRGPVVEYDEYARIMSDQYKALMAILLRKYGEPSANNGLPEWTDLNKGYIKRCAIWEIGSKKIEIQISCEGVNYFLNLEVFKPSVELTIQREQDEKEKNSTKRALDIL